MMIRMETLTPLIGKEHIMTPMQEMLRTLLMNTTWQPLLLMKNKLRLRGKLVRQTPMLGWEEATTISIMELMTAMRVMREIGAG